MEEFLTKLERQNAKVIAIDFDKVIHKNSKGFHDGTVYDEPVVGAKEALDFLSNFYEIIIFTCKARPDRPLINGKTGKDLIWEWLEKHELDQYIKAVTHNKPRAKFYIDDKGIRFENWKDTLSFILESVK